MRRRVAPSGTLIVYASAPDVNVGPVVAFIERLFGFQVLPAGVYFINYLPSDLHLSDVVTIGITACLLAFAATIYPSLSASRVRPAEALRYE